MERIQKFLKVGFAAKVIIPTVLSMVALLMITIWIVNSRIRNQFQTEAGRSLVWAESALKQAQDIRHHDLLLRYHNLPREPRVKAVLQAGDAQTLEGLLVDLLGEQGVDVLLVTPKEGAILGSSKRDPLLSIPKFEKSIEPALRQALQGEETVDTVCVDDRLFNVISIPVFGTSDTLVGALTVGSEVGAAAAQQFRLITQCQIVLLAHGKVVGSTLASPELNEHFADLFKELGARTGRSGTRDARLGGEHYFCSAGTFGSLAGDSTLGWLLLSSYEQPLRALQSTQQMVVIVISGGIFLGTALVWLLVRKTTQPLRDLRDSAEAVGKGDFSRRVVVASGDECGELAWVFNQMTENLQRSREQLEHTVETLKSTQAQLVQSEKLSGIGQFVAGVAHELNNPLTTVMGFSELLARSDTNAQHKRHLEMIHKSAQRCQRIVQSLLSFARRHQPERKLCNVNELIENAVEFLLYQLRTSNITVQTRLDPALPRAMLDPHQLQQVFLNIINNARQAIESYRSDGLIQVTTEKSGNNIRITLKDNGPGIPEHNLSRVFDPFFTTKEVGQGTGLGLSLCYGIVREHGGAINVRSKLGDGAAFVIDLPAASESEMRSSALAPASRPPDKECAGTGKKILVIDDEEGILEMLRETLATQGYEVDTAQDGESALRRIDNTSYDLALCDWKMPGLSGEQVYRRIKTIQPRLSERMIFITGDVVNDRTRAFLDQEKKLCLSKPFSLIEFRDAVGKALAG